MREGPVMEGRETEIDQGYKIQEIGSPDNIQNPDPIMRGGMRRRKEFPKPVISQTSKEGAAQNQGQRKFREEITQFQELEKSKEEIVQVQNIANLETYIEDQIGTFRFKNLMLKNSWRSIPSL